MKLWLFALSLIVKLQTNKIMALSSSAATTNCGQAKKLQDEPMHLGLNATTRSLTKVTGMEWYAQYAKDTASDGFEGRLVTMYTFEKSWDVWEMHPHGEEAVICTAGKVTLLQKMPDGIRKTVLKAGEYAVNPKGVWHSADVMDEPCTCLFITPGAETQNKAR